jgi:Tc5 transposase DNA-binding domain
MGITPQPSNRLTEGQKAELIKHHKQFPNIKSPELAKWCKIRFRLLKSPNPSTILKILKNSQRFESVQPKDTGLRKARAIRHERLDIALINWVLQQQNRRLCISDGMIREKARDLAALLNVTDMKFSNGWLQKFKNRHGLKQHIIHGESGDTQIEGIEEQLKTIRAKIKEYDLDDVYNFDETGVFYRMAPGKTIAQRQIEGFLFIATFH